MLKVEIKKLEDLKDPKAVSRLFYCDSVTYYKSGECNFVNLYNERAKVKTSQIILNPDQVLFVTEAE